MVRIVSDTSPLYSTQQAKDAGFAVSPLSVTIAGKTYREFDEISSEAFVSIIRKGHMPTSSQPAVGEVAAADLCENDVNVTVVNSCTLCGPHRYAVEKAVQWAKEGLGVQEIVAKVEEKLNSAKSFLVPADFDYLRRGGRLSPLVSYVGKAASLTPIMTQTDDGCRLTIAGIRRGFPPAVKFIASALEKYSVGDNWRIYISHAGALDKAELALKHLKEAFPKAVLEILPLSPAFITQGGPGCVAVQVIRA